MTTPKRLARCNTPITDRPLAAAPNTSYRLKGAFGWIMIGAMNDQGAMNEARRSTEHPRFEDLEKWDGTQYVRCAHATEAMPA